MAVAQRTAQAIALPFREAVDFFAGKTNVTTEHWTDVWRTGHTRAFMVAGAATEALVEDFRQSVARAIEQGTTLADFRRDFDAIVARHGWVHNGKPGWRAEILRHHLSMLAAGRHAQQSRPEVLAAFRFGNRTAAPSIPQEHLLWNAWSARRRPFGPPLSRDGWRCGCGCGAIRPRPGAAPASRARTRRADPHRE